MAQEILTNQASSGIVANKRAIFFTNTARISIKIISLTFTNSLNTSVTLKVWQTLDLKSPATMIRNLALAGGETIIITDGEKLMCRNGFFEAISNVAGSIEWAINYRIFDKANFTANSSINNTSLNVNNLSLGDTFRIKSGKLQVFLADTNLWYSLIAVLMDDRITVALTLDQVGEA